MTVTPHPGPRRCGSLGDGPRSWGEEGAVPSHTIPSCPSYPAPAPASGKTLPQTTSSMTTSSCGDCGRKSGSGYSLGTLEGWAGTSQLIQLQLWPLQTCSPPQPQSQMCLVLRAGFRLGQSSTGPVIWLIRHPTQGSWVLCIPPWLFFPGVEVCGPAQSLLPWSLSQRVPPALCRSVSSPLSIPPAQHTCWRPRTPLPQPRAPRLRAPLHSPARAPGPSHLTVSIALSFLQGVAGGSEGGLRQRAMNDPSRNPTKVLDSESPQRQGLALQLPGPLRGLQGP